MLAGVISYNSFISFALKKNNDKNVLEVKSTYVDNSFDDTRTLDTYLGRNYILEEDLIAAITVGGKTQLAEAVAEHLSPYAIANNEGVVETTNRLMRGLGFDEALDIFKAKG